MRQVTERTEGLQTALVRLTGTNGDSIIADATDALSGRWPADQGIGDLYGDGLASERIVATLLGANKYMS
jgi:UDP-N-acetylglucosamine 2-epimerase